MPCLATYGTNWCVSWRVFTVIQHVWTFASETLNILNAFASPSNSVGSSLYLAYICLAITTVSISFVLLSVSTLAVFINVHFIYSGKLLEGCWDAFWKLLTNINFIIWSSSLPTNPAYPSNLQMSVVYTSTDSPVYIICLIFLWATNGPSENVFFSACSILSASFWSSKLNCR